MMDAYERQQVKELAARMTPALMQRILEAPISKASQEQAAAIILECCAEAMMEGDPITRLGSLRPSSADSAMGVEFLLRAAMAGYPSQGGEVMTSRANAVWAAESVKLPGLRG